MYYLCSRFMNMQDKYTLKGMNTMRKWIFTLMMSMTTMLLHAQAGTSARVQTIAGEYYMGTRSEAPSWGMDGKVTLTLTPVEGEAGVYTLSFGDMLFGGCRRVTHLVLPGVRMSMDGGRLKLPRQRIVIDDMLIDGNLATVASALLDHDGTSVLTPGGLRLTMRITLSDDMPQFNLIFTSAELTTGVAGIEAATEAPQVYHDLQGRRVERPRRGIYVVGGRKVVVR